MTFDTSKGIAWVLADAEARKQAAAEGRPHMVDCPLCTPIPVPGCIECKGTRKVTEADAGHIRFVLARH